MTYALLQKHIYPSKAFSNASSVTVTFPAWSVPKLDIGAPFLDFSLWVRL